MKIILSITAIFALTGSADAFAPASSSPPAFDSTTARQVSAGAIPPDQQHESMYFLSPVEEETKVPTKPLPKKNAAKKPSTAHGKQGICTPAILAAKSVIGDEKFNKLRAKVISMHSDVIGSFVETSSTSFGESVLATLFDTVDANNNGKVEAEELQIAFQKLGFEWLRDKQVRGIIDRADQEGKGYLTIDEWMREAPKTLRTNLIKLAKKNGGELGFLS